MPRLVFASLRVDRRRKQDRGSSQSGQPGRQGVVRHGGMHALRPAGYDSAQTGTLRGLGSRQGEGVFVPSDSASDMGVFTARKKTGRNPYITGRSH